MNENGFWRVCEALDCKTRIELLRYLLEADGSEFPCVNELAEQFKLSSATMSVHLKKLATAGLVASKRADRRVYYRAFATTPDGERMLAALNDFFALKPDGERMRGFRSYVHALSHARRNAIVRVLHANPGMGVKDLAIRTDMPPQTVDRLWGELNQAHVVNLEGAVVPQHAGPESTLLELTVADSHF